MQPIITPFGDTAIAAIFTDVPASNRAQWLIKLRKIICSNGAPLLDCVIAFDSITIYYDIQQLHHSRYRHIQGIIDWLRETASQLPVDQMVNEEQDMIEIPVVYGKVGGMDLIDLAKQKLMTPDELIQLHTSTTYSAAAIGFLPGFAYLEGLPHRLHTPRRKTPRSSVPSGSVAIGGTYTGIYPSESPGGWHIIGQTAVTLFDVQKSPSALIQAGQRVRFISIS